MGRKENMRNFLILVVLSSSTLSYSSDEKVKSGIAPDITREVLIDNISRMRHCYQKELDKSKNSFEFESLLKFSVNDKGRTENIAVSTANDTDPKLSKVSKCVELVIKGILFPKPIGGGKVNVTQPINFYPKH